MTSGPLLYLTIEGASQGEATQMDRYSFTHYMHHYTGDSTADNIGKHTMMIRRTFEQLQKRQKRKFAGIFSTEAQASGLLVTALYNWGERRIIELIRTWLKNPRETNFWRLLIDYKDKIPRQTYDYVFYILSAAVIGENLGLFGFNFDNPLTDFREKFTG